MIAAFLASSFGRKIAGYAAVAVAVFVAIASVFRAGKKSAQVEGMKDQLKNVEKRHAVDNTVDASKPSAVRDELLRDWSKPS